MDDDWETPYDETETHLSHKISKAAGIAAIVLIIPNQGKKSQSFLAVQFLASLLPSFFTHRNGCSFDHATGKVSGFFDP